MNTTNIKKIVLKSALISLLGFSASGFAETGVVLSEGKTNVTGKTVGGISSLIVGGAVAGGPVGSLLGGLAGFWLGGEAQDQLQASEKLYEVRDSSGKVQHFRSPNHEFNVGDKVEISGIRIKPIAS